MDTRPIANAPMVTRPAIRGGDAPPLKNDTDCDEGDRDHGAVLVGEPEGGEKGSAVLGPRSSWTGDGEDPDIAASRYCGGGGGGGLVRVRRERRQLA